MRIIDDNKYLHEIEISLYDWGHLDTNPIVVADQVNTYLIQQGVYERGALTFQIKPRGANSSIIILKFPLNHPVVQIDDPDRISVFDT